MTANVLVVDDDRSMLKMLEMSLTQAGHKVATASSWQDVTGLLQGERGEKRTYDVIVLDLMMPERSGFDVLKSLQTILDPMPPVIVLTALTGIDNAIKALDLGADKYLTKPVTPEKLLKTIRETMAGSNSSRF